MKVLIIEDEPLAQRELIRLLKALNRPLEVMACLDSIEESVEWLQTQPKPELIFMDIQLADGLSFEIFNRIPVTVPVIFTTAYDAYAIQAFKVSSIDYLLKPVEEEALKVAFHKFETMKQQFATTEPASITAAQIEQLLRLNRPEYKSRFLTTVGDRIRHVDVEDIAYFYADDNTVYVVCTDRKKYIVNYTLDELEPLLNPRDFFRINRKYISSISAIADVNKYFNSRLKISLSPAVEDEVLISRVRVPGFLQWMDK